MRIAFALLASVLPALAIPAAAQTAAAAGPGADAPRTDVVVTGQRLSDTAAALRACLQRGCPPDQDIAASLAHAENLFVAGDYGQARDTLQDATGRNRRFAARYPVPVSDLLRASSRVSVHLGEPEDFRRETIASLEALKAGLPATDARVLAQRVEVGDMFANLGDADQARQIYRHVEHQARALNLPVEGAARLHLAALELRYAADTSNPGASREAALQLQALADDPRPDMAVYALVARVLHAEYADERGDPAPLKAVLAQLSARLPGNRPVLLHGRPVEVPGRPASVTINDEAPVRNALTRLPVGQFDGQWVDVAFWIRPDGSVEDADVLRTSRPSVKSWDGYVLKSVRTRRYAPLSLPAGDPGLLRVERYTYTSFFDRTVSGTRIRTRDGQPRVELLDLSLDPARAASAPAATTG